MKTMNNKKYLYSPWRLDYILSEKPDECVLCEIQKHEDDKGNMIVWRARHCYVMLNRYPYNNGHLMIVPMRHECSLGKLSHSEWAEMADFIRICEKALNDVYKCQGVNIGMNLGSAAGAGISEHLHIHLVPRWEGDSNFMSVVSGERVIPEPFDTAWENLHQAMITIMSSEV